MATKTEQNIVKQGISNKNIFWINMKAYQMLVDDTVMFAGGGMESEEERDLIVSFIKRNKKSYVKYETTVKVEYNEILASGKYKGLTVTELVTQDRKYAIWMRDNYNFGSQEKLKKEITEILK